jgi:plastocyanin
MTSGHVRTLPSHFLQLVGVIMALVLMLSACNGSPDTNGDDTAGDESTTSQDGNDEDTEDGKEESPTPKSEEELEQIEEASPLKKSACTARAKLKLKKGHANVQLLATDNSFDPQCPVGSSRGDLVKFIITNEGQTTHNFSAPARGLDFDIQPGGKQVVRMAMGEDKIEFFCKYHAGEGMRGAVFPGRAS